MLLKGRQQVRCSPTPLRGWRPWTMTHMACHHPQLVETNQMSLYTQPVTQAHDLDFCIHVLLSPCHRPAERGQPAARRILRISMRATFNVSRR